MAEDLIAAPWLNLTSEEKRVFGQLFRQADSESIGVVTGEAAVKFFEKTRLDPRVLGEIWQIADKENRGLLTPSGFSVVLRLIGHYQAGRDPTPELALRHGPLPRFENANVPILSPNFEPPLGPSPNALESQATGPGPFRLPPLTPEKSGQYAALFDKSGAHGGILPGELAKQIFERAGLPNEVLGRIWSLADTDHKGALGITEFIIAMHLLASFKTGQIRTLPNSLPFALYEAASRQSTNRSASGSAILSPVPKQATGASGSRAAFSSTSKILPQVTGPSSLWLITPADQSKFDGIFKNLDKSNRGYITGDEAVPFFSESKLPDDVLAQIWDLADINSAGRLSRDEFAVAMYLVRQQRGKHDGRESLPATLPVNLVPPSMRNQRRTTSIDAPPNFDAPAPALRSAAEDLFGLDALSSLTTKTENITTRNQKHTLIPPAHNLSPASANQMHPLTSSLQPPLTKPFTPSSSFGQSLTHQITGTSSISSSLTKDLHGGASSEDLLGDNDPEISKKLTGETAEVANLSNQVNTLSTQLREVQDQKTSYQNESIQSSTQKRELEERLAQLRTLYNNELNDVQNLQERHALTLNEIKNVQLEVEALEFSLQNLNNEHTLVFEALQADQLENSKLKERIRIFNSEIAQLKPALEKAKLSARQQKSMVEINKKLFATTEAEKDTIKNELEELNRTAKEHSEIPNTSSRLLASTPASNFTATSSTNPFFRRKENSSDKIPPLTDAFSDNRQTEGLSNNTFGSSFEVSSLNEMSISKPDKQDTRSISGSSVHTIPARAKSTDLDDIRVISSLSPELVASQVLPKPSELPLSSGARKISSTQSFPTRLDSENPSRQTFAPSHGSVDNFLNFNASNNMRDISKSPNLSDSSTRQSLSNDFAQNLSSSKPAPAAVPKFLSDELQSNIFTTPVGENTTIESSATESFIFKSPERLGSAKDDFDSAFAGFGNTAKSQERTNTGGSSGSGSAGGANIVESQKEFPPITEISDDSDSTSEGVGFDDDFATACPGSAGDKSMMTDIPVVSKTKSTEISSTIATLKSQSLATQTLPPALSNNTEVFENYSSHLESQPMKTNHDALETGAADSAVLVSNQALPAPVNTKDPFKSQQRESPRISSDDDFDNLEDAKEGDENDEVAKGSGNGQSNVDEFNSIFDSTLLSKGQVLPM